MKTRKRDRAWLGRDDEAGYPRRFELQAGIASPSGAGGCPSVVVLEAANAMHAAAEKTAKSPRLANLAAAGGKTDRPGPGGERKEWGCTFEMSLTRREGVWIRGEAVRPIVG